MHTALRAIALLLVAGALGGGLLIFATDKPEVQLAGAAESVLTESNMTLTLESSVFVDGGRIPPLHTCDGMHAPPPLSIGGVPAGTRSLALVMDDPDVPKTIKPDGVFDHWVLFNISPATTEITASAPAGTSGANSTGKLGYTGPCPPDREHRYFFKLFALDAMLDLNEGATKQQFIDAMAGHIVAEATLMGRYERLQ